MTHILLINILWSDRTKNLIAETNEKSDQGFVISKSWLKIPNTSFKFFSLLDPFEKYYYRKRKEPEIRHVALKTYLMY